MELNEVRDELDELRPDDTDDDTVEMLAASVGQLAMGGMQLDGADESERVAELRRGLLSAVVVASLEYALKHDLDAERAMEERLDTIREKRETQQAIDDAIESGDAEALAEALGAQQNEVPTDMFDGEDDGDTRGVY